MCFAPVATLPSETPVLNQAAFPLEGKKHFVALRLHERMADCLAAEVTEGGELTCLERLSLLQSRSYLRENKRGHFRARAVMDMPAAGRSAHPAAAKNVNEYNKKLLMSIFNRGTLLR